MTDFGDIELADAWDLERRIAPEQLAMRLHRLRVEVDALAGHVTPDWEDVDPDDRDEATAVAVDVVAFVFMREPDNPALLAEHIHESSNGRPWSALTDDERQIAIDLTILLLEWLEREGPR